MKQRKVRHVVVFMHHPFFLHSVKEPDGYSNLPNRIRSIYLDLFEQAGVQYVFSGHLHHNLMTTFDKMGLIANGPVGKPLGDGRSGMGVATVLRDSLSYQYFPLASLPEKISLPPASDDASVSMDK